MNRTDSHTNARRLAQAVRARREELGLSLLDVVKKGGPTKPTIIRYERGDIPHEVPPGTMAKFDHALDWEPGTAERILSGTDPQETGTVVVPLPVEPAPDAVDLLEVDSEKFRALVKSVTDLRGKLLELPTVPPEIREAAEKVTAIQTDLLLDQVTKTPKHLEAPDPVPRVRGFAT